MVTLIDRSANGRGRIPASTSDSYSGYKEPDTRVPPKARPVLDAISVNGVAIEESDILLEAQNHPALTPGAALTAAARALVIRQLLLQRAAELGIAAAAPTGTDGRIEADDESVIRLLIEREVAAPAASPEECRRFYDNNREKFRSETIFEASHMLIAADPADAPARKTALDEAERLTTILAGRPEKFAILARQYSACPSSSEGGNLGQLTRGSTVREFEVALHRLGEGEITAHPVESRFGFHVIRLARRIDGEDLPFDLVRDRIGAWLEASAWSKAVSQFIAVLAAEADIVGIDIAAADGPLLR